MKISRVNLKTYPRILLLALLATCLITPFSSSQPMVLQTKVFLSQSAVHPGEKIGLALKLEIAPGWHINAPEQFDEFLIPCALEISEAPDYRVVEYYYPPPERGKFSFSEAELTYFVGEVYLGVLLEVPATVRPGKVKIKGSFTFQACDDRSCIAPETLPLEAEIEVVPPSQPVSRLHPEIFSQIKFKTAEKAG